MHCSRRLIVQTLFFSRSYLHRQVCPQETLVVKGGTTWARNDRWILPENTRLPRNSQGSFTCRKSTTWDRRLYFPSEGRRAEDFSPWKTRRLRPGLNPRTLILKASTSGIFVERAFWHYSDMRLCWLLGGKITSAELFYPDMKVSCSYTPEKRGMGIHL